MAGNICQALPAVNGYCPGGHLAFCKPGFYAAGSGSSEDSHSLVSSDSSTSQGELKGFTQLGAGDVCLACPEGADCFVDALYNVSGKLAAVPSVAALLDDSWNDTFVLKDLHGMRDRIGGPIVVREGYWRQGLTLVHFSAQHKRFLRDRGCI
jgi:hypothetical protein